LEALKLTLPENIILGLAFIAQSFVILFVTGLEGNGYAGFAGFNPDQYISLITSDSVLLTFSLPALIGLVVLVAYAMKKDLDGLKNYILTINYPIIFAGLLILPQIIMYAKSGMYERYLLPSMFAVGLLTIYMLKYASPTQKLLKATIIVLLCGFLVVNGYSAYIYADAFAKDGQETNTMLRAVLHETELNSMILVVSDPREIERSHSIKVYFRHSGRENIQYIGYE
jgi:hypothetical protein